MLHINISGSHSEGRLKEISRKLRQALQEAGIGVAVAEDPSSLSITASVNAASIAMNYASGILRSAVEAPDMPSLSPATRFERNGTNANLNLVFSGPA